MASKVAEAYIAIKVATEGIASGLGAARGMASSGVSAIAKTVQTAGSAMGSAYGAAGSIASGAASMASKAWGATTESLKKVTSGVSALASSFKLAAVGVAAIAASADTSGVKLNAMLKGSGEAAGFSRGKLDEMAAGLSSVSGASGRVVREAQSIALSFGAVRGDVFEGMMKTLPDLAAAMGTDLTGAAREFGSALNGPADGLKLLEKLGVTIPPQMSDAFKSAAEGSMEGWKKAQQFILESVKKAAGGANAELQGTLAGGVGRLKGAFMDMADAFAPVLIPAIESAVSLMKQFGEAVSNNKAAFVAFGNGIAKAIDFVSGIFTKVMAFIDDMDPALVEMIGTFAGIATAAAVIVPIIGAIASAIGPIVSIIGACLSPVGLLIGAIVGLGIAIDQATGGYVWDAIKTAASATMEWLELVASNASLSFSIAWTAIQYGAQVALDAVCYAFFAVVGAAVGAAGAVAGTFSALWDNLKDIASTLKSTFLGVFSAMGAGLKAMLSLKNPATAFREKFAEEMSKAAANVKPMRGVGEAAAKGYSEGYDSVMNGKRNGSDRADALKKKLIEDNAKLNGGRKKKDYNADYDGEDEADVDGKTAGKALPNMIRVKFETVGLTSMWQKMQEKITGNDSVQALQSRTAKATEKIESETRSQSDILKSIDKGVREPHVAGMV